MTLLAKICAITALAGSGVCLLFIKTDREYINLAPTEGIDAGMVLEAGHLYEQTFIARRPTITRLGLFLRPTQTSIPLGDVAIEVRDKEKTLGQAALPLAFIDTEGAAQIRFSPPLTVTEQQAITIVISVPPPLSGAVRLQQRDLDDTFDATNVSFVRDGVTQDQPAAYQVYYRYRPLLAQQLAGLLLLGAGLLILPNLLVYILGLGVIFVLPLNGLVGFNWILFAYTAVALAGMIVVLHKDRLSLLPALLGANIFAFSTWFPLHLQGGRASYALAAALPLLFVLTARHKELSPRRRLHLWGALALFATLILWLVPLFPPATPGPSGIAQPRDVFLDPNQVAVAVKVLGSTWDHFGSYVGVINAALAVLGISFHGWRRKEVLVLGGLGALAAFSPLYRLPGLPIPPQHLVIMVTFAIAYFAAAGLFILQRFLHASPPGRDRVVTTVIALIVLIALLDLWQVAAATFEYWQLAV